MDPKTPHGLFFNVRLVLNCVRDWNYMTLDEQIEQFLAAEAFAVAGASTNRDKFGNKVLRCYQQHGRSVVPINPRAELIEGLACVPSVEQLPDSVQSLSIVTPPQITVEVVHAALQRGIRNLWMQPGAEHPEAIEFCRQAGANCIAGGPCLLVIFGFSDRH